MIDSRKKQAILLRQQGRSINEIAQRLDAAKSSVSIWTRGVVLSDEMRQALASKSHSTESIEKRRQSRMKSESVKRAIIRDEATVQIPPVTANSLWLIGTALYWAEGGKTQRIVRFSNGDPEMIRLMMKYFRQICHVPEQKFRGYIHIHEHLDVCAAEQYWSAIADIPLNQFYKTYNKPNKSSKNTRNSLPHGVFDIYISDAKLFLKIEGWMKGIYLQTNNTQ